MLKLAEGDSMLLNMLTGLLEDAVKALQRIERKVEDQTIIFKKILDKIDGLEQGFETEKDNHRYGPRSH